MKPGAKLDEVRVRFIWEQAIVPYIDEQFFGDQDRIKQFSYENVKSRVSPALRQSSGEGQADSESGGSIDDRSNAHN